MRRLRGYTKSLSLYAIVGLAIGIVAGILWQMVATRRIT